MKILWNLYTNQTCKLKRNICVNSTRLTIVDKRMKHYCIDAVRDMTGVLLPDPLPVVSVESFLFIALSRSKRFLCIISPKLGIFCCIWCGLFSGKSESRKTFLNFLGTVFLSPVNQLTKAFVRTRGRRMMPRNLRMVSVLKMSRKRTRQMKAMQINSTIKLITTSLICH